MSTRVPLSLEEFQNPEWAEQGIVTPVIRLVARTVDLMGTDEIRGIVPKPECCLPAHIGKVICYLADAKRNPVPVDLIAYLAPVDNVALLLGFQGILEQFHLSVNYSQRMAYLEKKIAL